MAKKKRRNVRPKKWRPENVIKAYEFARDGMRMGEIAKALGVNRLTYLDWYHNRPMFKMGVTMGRKFWHQRNSFGPSFAKYMHAKLPRRLRDIWKDINQLELKGASNATLRNYFGNRSKRARQNIFLYAWLDSNFSIIRACRKVGISRQTFFLWCKDPKFQALVDEIQEAKKDFFEGSLIRLVAGGDTAATIFANKTVNRDRGYSDRQQVDVNVSGEVKHRHELVSMEQLQLPIATQKLLLQHIRKAKEIDAEVVEQKQLGAG